MCVCVPLNITSVASLSNALQPKLIQCHRHLINSVHRDWCCVPKSLLNAKTLFLFQLNLIEKVFGNYPAKHFLSRKTLELKVKFNFHLRFSSRRQFICANNFSRSHIITPSGHNLVISKSSDNTLMMTNKIPTYTKYVSFLTVWYWYIYEKSFPNFLS